MIIAFIIWSIVASVFLIIGIVTRKSKKPAGFWANGKVPEVNDIIRYNRAVSLLWFVFAVLLELFGIPLLFCEQNSPIAFIPMFGTFALVLEIMIAYMKIEAKYKK